MSAVLEITTMVGCPLLCTYCPQDALKKNYNKEKYMSMNTLKTVLATVPLSVNIVFAGFSEPWANPVCTELLIYTLSEGYSVDIYTTLYGMKKYDTNKVCSLLNEKNSKIKNMWIHLPDDHNNMPGWNLTDEWNYAYTELKKIKKIKFMTLSNENSIHHEISAPLNVENWYLHTRSDNLEVENIGIQFVTPPSKNEFPITCTRNKNYHANVLLPDGTVTLCCMDYSLKHKIGNLLVQRYTDVINGDVINNIKELNREENFSNKTLCRTCNDTFCITPYNTNNYYELYPEHKS
jgi:hypothetical protein